MPTLQLKQISFGGTAAVITNMALVTGMQAATSSRSSTIASILIIAIADNLTDSLSVHIYQESERMDARPAFLVTISNFFARIVISLGFVVLVYCLPIQAAIMACLFWGLSLLCIMTYLLARQRKVAVRSEILKHVGVAVSVILLAKLIGYGIQLKLGP